MLFKNKSFYLLFFSCVSFSYASDRTFLITSHSPDSAKIISNQGQVLWTYSDINHPQDAQVLPDGRIFCSEMPGAKLISRDGSVLWTYRTPDKCQNPVAQALPDGRFLVGNEGPCKLIELESDGSVAHEIQLHAASNVHHGQFRFCRKTEAGTYLTPLTKDNQIREWAADGTVLREFPSSKLPVSVIRLPNGNTLIGAKRLIAEYDADTKLVWSLESEDIPDVQLEVVTGLIRLKNGNTLFGNYGAAASEPDIIEVSPDKKVVWSLVLPEVSKVAMVQLLNTEMLPSDEVAAR